MFTVKIPWPRPWHNRAAAMVKTGEIFSLYNLGFWVVFQNFTCSTRKPLIFHLREHFYPANLMKYFPELNPQL